jgi:hypothetical protein
MHSAINWALWVGRVFIMKKNDLILECFINLTTACSLYQDKWICRRRRQNLGSGKQLGSGDSNLAAARPQRQQRGGSTAAVVAAAARQRRQ